MKANLISSFGKLASDSVACGHRFIEHSAENPAGSTPKDWISRAQKLTWAQVLAMMTIPRSVKCSFRASMTCDEKEIGVLHMQAT